MELKAQNEDYLLIHKNKKNLEVWIKNKKSYLKCKIFVYEISDEGLRERRIDYWLHIPYIQIPDFSSGTLA